LRTKVVASEDHELVLAAMFADQEREIAPDGRRESEAGAAFRLG